MATFTRHRADDRCHGRCEQWLDGNNGKRLWRGTMDSAQRVETSRVTTALPDARDDQGLEARRLLSW